MKKNGLIIFVLVFLTVVSLSFSLITVHIVGESMIPSIPNDAHVLGIKTTRVKRFDVVSFVPPDDPDEHYIKRIIGMPGDIIEFKSGVLYLSGQAIDESYLSTAAGKIHTEDFNVYEDLGQLTVPEGHVFVLGDNRPASNDSRYFGFVEKSAIECRATLIFWPPSAMSLVHSEYKLIDDDALVALE